MTVTETKREIKFTGDKLLYDALLDKGNNLAESATPEQVAYLAKARQILQETPPKKIYEDGMGPYPEIPPILPGAYPFLYCRMRRSGRGQNGYITTNEMGPLANNTDTAAKMFKNFTGGNNSAVDTYTIPPSIQFVGTDARWLKSDGWLEYASGSNAYNYSSYDLILMFLKNTTELPLTRTFFRYLSSDDANSTYNNASTYVGTPDRSDADRDKITSIQWSQVHTKSADIYGETASFAVTVPEKKTVALLFNSCPRFYANDYSQYSFYSSIGIYDFSKFLTEGLEVDHERTLKAFQYKTPNIYEIWR